MSLAALVTRPAGLPLLLLAPLVWLVFALLDRRRAVRLARMVGPRLPFLADRQGGRVRAVQRAAFALALLLALVAALGPTFGAPVGDEEWRGVDLVVCLDVSRSMLAQDVAPDRLGRAKQEIHDLSQRAQGDRLALVLFAGEARLAVPLTHDGASFAALADLADPAAVMRGGTDLGAALSEALGALEGRLGDAGAIVLLTDGEDLGGRGLEVARACGEQGVVVHGVGFGTTRGGKIPLERGAFLLDRTGADVVSAMDATSLERITDATGGSFVTATTASRPLVTLYEDQVLPMARASVRSSDRERRENQFQWPLAFALVLWLVDAAVLGGARRARRPITIGAKSLARAVSLLALVLLTGCGDATREGRAAWEAGRHDDALAAFDRAAVEVGDGASAELLHDVALAALATGDIVAAEFASLASAERGGDAFEALDAFVRGNVHFARSRIAERQARDADGDPRALMAPITYAENALAAWQKAAASRADWPEARRNVERGLLWLGSLREQKGDGSGTKNDRPPDAAPTEDPGKEEPPKPAPPEPTPEPGGSDEGDEPETNVETADLPAGNVLGLFELLQKKERERQAVRHARRRAKSAKVERDW